MVETIEQDLDIIVGPVSLQQGTDLFCIKVVVLAEYPDVLVGSVRSSPLPVEDLDKIQHKIPKQV